MGDILLVALNWPKLKQNLSREHGEPLTDRSLVKWLTDAGFAHAGGRWRVPEEELSHVDPSEVMSAEEAPGAD